MKFTSHVFFASLLVAPLSSQAVTPRKLNSSTGLDKNPPVNFAVLSNTISKFFDPSTGGASSVPFESLTSSFIATGTRRSKGNTQAAIAAMNSAGTDAGDEIAEFLKSTSRASNTSESAASKAQKAAVNSQKATVTTTKVVAVIATTTVVPIATNAAASTGSMTASTTREAVKSSTTTSTSTPAKTTSATPAIHKDATTTKLATTTATATVGAATGREATTTLSTAVSHAKAKVQVARLSKLTVPAMAITANKSTKAVSVTTTTTKLAEKDVDALPMAGFAEDEPTTTTATTTSTPVNASAPAVHKVMANISEAVIAHPGLNQTVSMADAVASLDTAQQSDAKAKMDVALGENSTEKEQEMKQLRKEITAELRSEFEAQLKDQLHHALQEEHIKEGEVKKTATTTTTSTTTTTTTTKATTTQPITTTTTTTSTHKVLTTTTTTHETARQKSWHQHDRSRRKHFKQEAEKLQSIAHERILDLHRQESALTQFERLQTKQAAAQTAAKASERSFDSVTRAEDYAEADGTLFNDRSFQDVDVPSEASKLSGTAAPTTSLATTTTTEASVASWWAPITARARSLLARLLGETVSKPFSPPAAALLQNPAFERMMEKQSAARTAAKVVEEHMEDIAASDEWVGHESEDVNKLQELASVNRAEQIRAATKDNPHFLSPAEIGARQAKSVHMSDTWVHLEQQDNFIKKALSTSADNDDLSILGSIDGIQDRAMRQLNDQLARADQAEKVSHVHLSERDPETKQLHEPFVHLQEQDEESEHEIEANPDMGA